MENKLYTIVDLAKMLGMSKSTVSRALRNQFDVSPETRAKVMELASQLDFKTNTLAASLRENKSYILGVIIPSFAIPFYSIALGGIQAAASEMGYNIMVCQTDERFEKEKENINFLLKSRVDGILISLSKDTGSIDHLMRIHRRGIPVVMFNRISENPSLPHVIIDDYEGALHACRYLVKSLCVKIAHISGPMSLNLSRKRMEGYSEALREAGLPLNENLIVESDFTFHSGRMAAQKLLSNGELPDAIFCVCDAVAFGVMAVIRERGLKIPDDISIMGFTNEPVSSIVFPSLTTISQPIEKIGKTAVQVLIEHLNYPQSPHNRHKVVLPTRLIERDSTKKNEDL